MNWEKPTRKKCSAHLLSVCILLNFLFASLAGIMAQEPVVENSHSFLPKLEQSSRYQILHNIFSDAVDLEKLLSEESETEDEDEHQCGNSFFFTGIVLPNSLKLNNAVSAPIVFTLKEALFILYCSIKIPS